MTFRKHLADPSGERKQEGGINGHGEVGEGGEEKEIGRKGRCVEVMKDEEVEVGKKEKAGKEERKR